MSYAGGRLKHVTYLAVSVSEDLATVPCFEGMQPPAIHLRVLSAYLTTTLNTNREKEKYI
jgi:hypothetical protein